MSSSSSWTLPPTRTSRSTSRSWTHSPWYVRRCTSFEPSWTFHGLSCITCAPIVPFDVRRPSRECRGIGSGGRRGHAGSGRHDDWIYLQPFVQVWSVIYGHFGQCLEEAPRSECSYVLRIFVNLVLTAVSDIGSRSSHSLLLALG